MKTAAEENLPPSPQHAMVQIGLMAALTAVGAQLRIPLPHIPITLQMTFVGLAGIWLGPWRGATSQCVYLAAGLVGAPVFAKGGGPQYVLEPTFGFLLGFVPGAWVTGCLARRSSSYLGCLLAVYAGLVAVYAAGVPYFLFIFTRVLGEPLPAETLSRILLLPLPKDLAVGLATAFIGFRMLRALRRYYGI